MTVGDDMQSVAELDRRFQAAVKVNDADVIDQILAADFTLITGNGQAFDRNDLIAEARSGSITYTLQDEDPGSQTVRVWGDTAVVTALLHIAGLSNGESFVRSLWFSDTYVRTPTGWKYAFAQASLPLPNSADLQARFIQAVDPLPAGS